MKHPLRFLCCLILIAAFSFSYGQKMEEYNYKQELKGVSEQWHKLILPNGIFGETSQELADIRIFGLKENKDTIEVPYLLHLSSGKTASKEVAFKTLNASHNDKGYYFTFKIPTEEAINQIKLDFAQENFDWRIRLEGSHDQNEWFSIVEDYRILSIKNEQTDFQFTKLSFPSSKYRFFRVLIDSKEKLRLNSASIAQNEVIAASFREYKIRKVTVKENKQSKQTEIDVELQLPVRASYINIGISDTFDYYRPLSIQYLADSFKTEQGWKYNYSTLASGTLNSMEKKGFQFNSTTVQKLRILIDNQNNPALSIDSIEVKGYVHELIARFTEQADYYLIYGNKNVSQAHYDIERFTDNIPDTLEILELGEKQAIEQKEIPLTEPLFKNKSWLWAIMIVIIVLLGWFSIKMIKKEE